MGEGKLTEENVQIKEFVKSDVKSNLKKKASQAKRSYSRKKEEGRIAELLANKALVALIAYVIAAIVVIVISIWACRVAVVPVCVIVIIETLLAACLHNLPVWLHGIVAAAQIVVGVLTGQTVFVLLCAALYVAAVVALMYIMGEPD